MKKFDTLRVMTNFSCNQRCSFCYQGKWDANFIEFSHIYQELEKHRLQDSKLNEVFNSVTILGGEPTLHPKLKQLIDHFAVDQMIEIVRLNTNGAILLSGRIPLDTIENLDVLCVDMGLGQLKSLPEDILVNMKKLDALRRIMDEYPKLTLKLNFIHASFNHRHQFHYMDSILERLDLLKFPQDRLMSNVCQDVYGNKEFINAKTYADIVGGFYLGQEKYFDKLSVRGYTFAYFTFNLYGNTEDFLFVWNQGSTTSFKEYLETVGKQDCLERIG